MENNCVHREHRDTFVASDLQGPRCSDDGVSAKLLLTSSPNAKKTNKQKSIEFYISGAAIFLFSNRDEKEKGKEDIQQ